MITIQDDSSMSEKYKQSYYNGTPAKKVEFTYDDLSPAFNSLTAKIIGTLDGYFELVFYLVFVFLANRYQTDQELNFHWKSKDIKITKWPKKLQYFSYFLVLQLIFFIILAFISIPWTFLDRNTFIIFLYIFLAPLYIITGFLPLFMRQTIYSLRTWNWCQNQILQFFRSDIWYLDPFFLSEYNISYNSYLKVVIK